MEVLRNHILIITGTYNPITTILGDLGAPIGL